MGLIKAAIGSIGGGLADQWLEAIRPADMDRQVCMTSGIKVREDKRSSNTKSTADVISNGTRIQVYDNQFMMLIDGGKVVDYTAEPGYYTVSNSSAPSLFNGQFMDSLKDVWERFKFGGTPSYSQKAIYINLQEIPELMFGTKNPISYYDSDLDADLYIRAHGRYSVKVTNPILFYQQVLSKDAYSVNFSSIYRQYNDEFLSALQSTVNQMSADGISIRRVASKSNELRKYMADALDEEWNVGRGFEVCSVGMEVSYDDETRELFKMRSQGSMLKDATIREGYVQGSIARGLEAAGSNEAGAGVAFMGMGMGMQGAGGFMNAASNTNAMQMQQQQQQAQQQQAQQQAQNGWQCSCGNTNTGKFCNNCGTPKPEPKPANSWTCSCGNNNTGKFCNNCGTPKPSDNGSWTCSCGNNNTGKFCNNCGSPKPTATPNYKCDKCGWVPEDPSTAPKFCPECGDIFNESDTK